MKIGIVVKSPFGNIELGHESIDEVVDSSKGSTEWHGITANLLSKRASDDDKEAES